MSVQRYHDTSPNTVPLRTCPKCGKQAFTLEDLDLFKKDARAKYGRATICKECESFYQRNMTVKTCSQCERELPLTSFFRDRSRPDGYRSYCKDCSKKYATKENWDKQNNKPETKKRKSDWINQTTMSTRLLALKQLSHPREPYCIECGNEDVRVLSIDHINDDGNVDRKMHQRLKLYKSIISEPEESAKRFQVLCRNCNWIKSLEARGIEYVSY